MIILFDLDGTLIDSTEAILESFHTAFDVHAHRHPSDEAIKTLIGHPLDVMFSELGVDASLVWEFVASYKEHYREISRQKTKLLKNAREAIALASELGVLGVVTTKTGKYSQILLEHFGLMDSFSVLVGREHVEKPKPDAEPIHKALALLGSSDKDIWMIGDTKMDLLSARSAGISSIGVLCGYGTKESLVAHTEYIFADALSAIKFLQSRK